MSLRLNKAVIAYDVGGWTASALTDSLRLDKLTILVAPNGSGKTTILSSIHPVFLAPFAAHIDYVKLSLRGYSSLRLIPPAIGYSEVIVNGKRYAAAWTRISIGSEHYSSMNLENRIEKIIHIIGIFGGNAARDFVKKLINVAANIVRDTRIPRFSRNYTTNALAEKLRQAYSEFVEDWNSIESIPGSERGLRIKKSGDILNYYLSILFRLDKGGARLLSATLSHYKGDNAIAIRFPEKDLDGLQVVHYHPSLSLRRAHTMSIAESAWGVVAQNHDARSRFLDLCEAAIKGCADLETLKVKGTRITGIRVKGWNSKEYFIPLETLGWPAGLTTIRVASRLCIATTRASPPSS